MKIVNNSNKVIGLGEIHLLPGDNTDIDESVFSARALEAYERMGMISVIRDTPPADKDAESKAKEEAAAKLKAEAEKKAAEAAKKAAEKQAASSK